MNSMSRRNFVRASILAGTLAIPTVAIASEQSASSDESSVDFSFLDDMTINQLRELQKEVNARLGDDGSSDNSSSISDEEVFSISQQAYNDLTEAFDLTSTYGSDIYNAWYEGIFNSKKLSVSYLSSKTSLSEEDVKNGVAASSLGGVDAYKQASEEERSEAQEGADELLDFIGELGGDYAYSSAVGSVVAAYGVNGTSDKISSLLSNAKDALRTISDEYSDYEYYPTLKDYYSAVNAYFDFCESPTGSFQQLSDTRNNYENDAREYQNDLDFVFGE